MSEVLRGKILWFSAKKGYGFAEWKPGIDIFCHFSDIIMKDGGFKTVKKDDLVQFEVGKNLAGEPKAINVQVINEI